MPQIDGDKSKHKLTVTELEFGSGIGLVNGYIVICNTPPPSRSLDFMKDFVEEVRGFDDDPI
jgi:hypothetical protein